MKRLQLNNGAHTLRGLIFEKGGSWPTFFFVGMICIFSPVRIHVFARECGMCPLHGMLRAGCRNT